MWASDIHTSDTGHASFVLHYGTQQAAVELGLVGEHHVANALAAASVAILWDQQLTNAPIFSPTPMLEVRTGWMCGIVTKSQSLMILIMQTRIQCVPVCALAHLGRGKRTIAVLGQMLELGESSVLEHHEVGRIVADLGIDILIGIGSGMEPTITHTVKAECMYMNYLV